MISTETIVAIATSQTISAIAIIRVSGNDAFTICNTIFKHYKIENFVIANANSHKAYFGNIVDGNEIIDEVLLTIFKAPNSFTGENTVEISCHGSVYIQQKIVQLILHNGAKSAIAGEFTMRAFKNGRMDLSQAEAVADLIASENLAMHKIAINQLKGNISIELNNLRQKLIDFASLLELELDFAEEDVEFANRKELKKLLVEIGEKVTKMSDTFSLGNSIKKGVPIVIAGKPNVGKSTLLNTLLQEEKAIVSEIAGTTRDTIEDTFNINGIAFRLTDTAGIRSTTDIIESIGISKTFEKIEQSALLLYVLDAINFEESDIETVLQNEKINTKKILFILNKTDMKPIENIVNILNQKHLNFVAISAKNNIGIEELKLKLVELSGIEQLQQHQIIITNIRHFEALKSTALHIEMALQNIAINVSSDFLAQDIRIALMHLGSITGTVSSDDLLGNIFSKFCIGK